MLKSILLELFYRGWQRCDVLRSWKSENGEGERERSVKAELLNTTLNRPYISISVRSTGPIFYYNP